MASYFCFCCNGISHCCKSFSRCCSTFCICPEDRPNPLFLSYTIVFNAFSLPAVIIGFFNLGSSCAKPLHVFVLVAGLLGFFFIGFAVRLYIIFCKPYTVEDFAHNGKNCCCLSGPVFKRAAHVFWYNPVVFIFFFAAPFGIIWGGIGLVWRSRSSNNEDDCDAVLKTTALICSLCLLIYLLSCWLVAILSLGAEARRPLSSSSHTHPGGSPSHSRPFEGVPPPGPAVQYVNHPGTDWSPTTSNKPAVAIGVPDMQGYSPPPNSANASPIQKSAIEQAAKAAQVGGQALKTAGIGVLKLMEKLNHDRRGR